MYGLIVRDLLRLLFHLGALPQLRMLCLHQNCRLWQLKQIEDAAGMYTAAHYSRKDAFRTHNACSSEGLML